MEHLTSAADTVSTLVAEHSTVFAVASAVLAGAIGISYLSSKLRTHEERKSRVKYLRWLFRGCLARIKDANGDTSKLIDERVTPVLQEAMLFDPSAVVDVKEVDRMVRKLKYTEEAVQRQLEALDNIKPNASLIEFTVRYPLPEDGVDDVEDENENEEDERLPHDILFDNITKSFTGSERKSLVDQFEKIKVARKAVVQSLLSALEQIDAEVERLEASIK
ncbi:hypothetical protein BCR44DRAFT_54898 [Catenaria anguillulae PL171]|uniref:Uncharacterized protein n=1 Tax=Catenaria anguillulae PL171 TaxID=765915 RepID=A0A1Y2HAQ7_9FUNG|nr:hypothetical protein BCR44DRAFT_54898 [Catenaria anguillulae PL171]